MSQSSTRKTQVSVEAISKTSIPLTMEDSVFNDFKSLAALTGSLEWSGVIFYKLKGNPFEDAPENCNIHITHFILMDIGSSGYTEFEFDSDVVKFMVKNKLKGFPYGLVHSHHNMQTYFSGGDIDELADSAKNHKFYLSLIVNNKMEMCARLASQVEISIEGYSIKPCNLDVSVSYTKKEISKKVIYWDCYIQKSFVISPALEKRWNAIKEKKEEERKAKTIYNPSQYPLPNYANSQPSKNKILSSDFVITAVKSGENSHTGFSVYNALDVETFVNWQYVMSTNSTYHAILDVMERKIAECTGSTDFVRNFIFKCLTSLINYLKYCGFTVNNNIETQVKAYLKEYYDI